MQYIILCHFFHFFKTENVIHIFCLRFQIFFSKKYEKPAEPFLETLPLPLPVLLWIQTLCCAGKSDQDP